MSDLDRLDARYRLILCDIWGVVHDGVTLYPGAAERLRQWRGEQRCVALITNAPRTAEAVEQQLDRIGLPHDAYDFVVTSGEAGIGALTALDEPVGFVGTAADRAILESRDVRITDAGEFTDFACTGLVEGRPDPEQYRADLERWVAQGAAMHCLNPDRVVVRGGVMEACAGALADIYEALGGRVHWYGKPHRAIYTHALRRAGEPPSSNVLAIGDGLQTDILGAARMGFDAIFVSGGIHAGEPFPEDFGDAEGLSGWAPVRVVEGLA
ncbi:MAG TPA: TIGR01459 family HAD-type hydrolase [Sphingomicrobium sp.]